MESFNGFISSVGEALRVIEAARLGLIPMITQRLKDNDRTAIRSGAIFVFDNNKVQRWTDGLHWTASRVSGHFLTYKQKDCVDRLLVKKSLSVITCDNKRYGLVSYYYPEDSLRKISSDPICFQITVPTNLYFRRIAQLVPDAKNNCILAPLNDDSYQTHSLKSNYSMSSPLSSKPTSYTHKYISSCIPSHDQLPTIKAFQFPASIHPYKLPPMRVSYNSYPPTISEDQRQLRLINNYMC